MPPDLNSLPPSRPPSMSGSPLSQRPRRISLNHADASRPSPPSPRSPSLSSLQAAATINAGLSRSPSNASPARTRPNLERRRSSLINNFSINDPAIPAPGEMQHSNGSVSGSPRLRRSSFVLNTSNPHHQRQPSLGELHQALETEQEAQVNRLLHMIRIQQDQLAQMQRQQQQEFQEVPSTETSTLRNSPTSLNTSVSLNHMGVPQASQSSTHRPLGLSQQSPQRRPSAGHSPSMRPHAGSLGPLTEDFLLGGTRDECAFYQAETQTLTRENQMLKLRIRELGKSTHL